MSAPPLVVNVPGRGRHYQHPVTEELFPSVTNIIGVMDKPALVGWAARETAKVAWRNRTALSTIEDETAAVDMLKNARYRTMQRRADLGTWIHETCEALSLDEPLPGYPPESAPYLDQFLRFVADFDPTFHRVELTVFNRGSGYAGTADALILVDGHPLLIDHKTSGTGVYPEVALQLAALRYAEEAWSRDTGEVFPMPPVEACAALWLQEDRYTLYLVNATETAFSTFLGLLRAWPWTKGADRGAVGPAVNRKRLLRALEVSEPAQPLIQPSLEIVT